MVIVLHIFMDDIAQVTVSKDEHSIQTFTFDASYKSFNDTIQMRSHRQGADGFDTRVFKNPSELLGEEGVPIMDQIFLVLQKA